MFQYLTLVDERTDNKVIPVFPFILLGVCVPAGRFHIPDHDYIPGVLIFIRFPIHRMFLPKLAQYLPQESLIPVKYGSQGNINQPVIGTNKIIGLDDLSKGRQGSQEYITVSQFVSARLEVFGISHQITASPVHQNRQHTQLSDSICLP